MTDTERFRVAVRLLAEPALWCWEIRDRQSGCLTVSSWDAVWMAYSSREEAEAAGHRYLRRLTRGMSSMDGWPLARAS